MSQREWAQYFLATKKPENTEIGWSPGEAAGQSTLNKAKKHYQELVSGSSSPKESGNIVAVSYKASGKLRKRKSRRNRKIARRTRRARR